ncbi:MAG: glycosyltransferase [Bacilli bacterium]|nr:glycosyltransferase [Bacilli bacterium]
MKVALINHAFQKPFFRTRWVEFAKKYKDIDLYLIAPKEYAWGNSKSLTYGEVEIVKAESFDNENFHFVAVNAKPCVTKGWKSPDLYKTLKAINPDIIYHIGSHTQNPLFQTIDIKRKHFKKVPLLAFSMRGINTNKRSRISLIKHDKNIFKNILRIPMYFLDLYRLNKVNKYVDCMVCHYPDAKDLFIKEGFKKRICVQTQVGVNTNIFYPNQTYREEIRKKYNLGSSFVFGSASRFNYSKGILQILDALTFDGDWKYLLIGSGLDSEVEEIKKKIENKGLNDKVIMTGYIETNEMPKYWNALDCAIHFPISTPKWIETFSLALVQAMASKKAVIGSSSGSVPYQVGDNGIIVEEGNSSKLAIAMQQMLNDKSLQEKNAQDMYNRATQMFSSSSLNEQFYNLIQDVYSESGGK